jgi:hypothetical protein
MIDTIRHLCRWLMAPDLAARAVATSLGTVVADHGGRLQVDVQPEDAAFAAAQVVRQADSDEPTYVRLVLAPGARRTVADLSRAFGRPRVFMSRRPGAGEVLVFSPHPEDEPIVCAVIAEVGPSDRRVTEGEDHRAVPVVMVRRDIRQLGGA